MTYCAWAAPGGRHGLPLSGYEWAADSSGGRGVPRGAHRIRRSHSAVKGRVERNALRSKHSSRAVKLFKRILSRKQMGVNSET